MSQTFLRPWAMVIGASGLSVQVIQPSIYPENAIAQQQMGEYECGTVTYLIWETDHILITPVPAGRPVSPGIIKRFRP